LLRRRAVSLACVGLTASCSSSGPKPAAKGTADIAVPGTILVLAGADPFSADVYRLHIAPVSFARVSYSKPKFGVSTLTASCCEVVVADARDAGIDHIERLTAHGFMPVPGVDTTAGREDPQFVDDTTLAYFEPVPKPAGPTSFSYTLYVRTVNLSTHAVSTLLSDNAEVSAYAVSPGGLLAYVELTSDGKVGTLMVRDASGRRLVNTPGGIADDPVWLRWNVAQPLLAVGDIKNRATELLASDGSLRGRLGGWTALSWAPDGSAELLVTDGHRIAVWRTGETTPHILGALTSGGIFEATWTAGDPLR
jgi:hypothetical protein